jgi:hypothetical protein
MGGLKNVYAIGAGMVAALTNESATSKSVYLVFCPLYIGNDIYISPHC